MKVICRYGHFALYPSEKEDVIHFQRLFKLALYRVDDYFTFLGLKDLPRWSQVLRPFGGLPAVKNFEGVAAWDVMKANDFVYSLVTGTIVPRASVVAQATVLQTSDCAVYQKPLLQPNSLIKPGVFLVGYQGEINIRSSRLYMYSQETFP